MKKFYSVLTTIACSAFALGAAEPQAEVAQFTTAPLAAPACHAPASRASETNLIFGGGYLYANNFGFFDNSAQRWIKRYCSGYIVPSDEDPYKYTFDLFNVYNNVPCRGLLADYYEDEGAFVIAPGQTISKWQQNGQTYDVRLVGSDLQADGQYKPNPDKEIVFEINSWSISLANPQILFLGIFDADGEYTGWLTGLDDVIIGLQNGEGTMKIGPIGVLPSEYERVPYTVYSGVNDDNEVEFLNLLAYGDYETMTKATYDAASGKLVFTEQALAYGYNDDGEITALMLSDGNDYVATATVTVGKTDNGREYTTLEFDHSVFLNSDLVNLMQVENAELTLSYNLVAAMSSVESVGSDGSDAPEVYYNLQGARINRPEAGVCIVRKGNKATKIFIR